MAGDLIEVDALLSIISAKEENLKTMSVQRRDNLQDYVFNTGGYSALQELKQAVTTYINKQRN
jgi:hypothetical protein